MDIDVTSVFPTFVGRFHVPDAGTMNDELRALVLADAATYPSLGRSNIGGWHSRPDFLARSEPATVALSNWVTWALKQMIVATAGSTARAGSLRLSGWATICRAGTYHAPHTHPDSAWSGVYYVDAGSPAPPHVLSGVLEFLDPRSGAEAVTAPGDPYGAPVRVHPEPGLLVVFPSWLQHWVHPYMGATDRVAISFNAAAETHASPGDVR